MTRLTIAALLLALASGCSTLHEYGIGGPPQLFCRQGEGWIGDPLLGSEAARLGTWRRFPDADELCALTARLPK